MAACIFLIQPRFTHMQSNFLRFAKAQLQQLHRGNSPVPLWNQHTQIHPRSSERGSAEQFRPGDPRLSSPIGKERATDRGRAHSQSLPAVEGSESRIRPAQLGNRRSQVRY